MKKIYFVSKYLIYGLAHPITKELRYIGKSMSGMSRPNSHCYSYYLKSDTYHTNWIKSLLVEGLRPEVVIIQELDSPEFLNQREIYWIKHFKELGYSLTNLTLGGEGQWGFRLSDKTKQKLSQIARLRSKPIKDQYGVVYQTQSDAASLLKLKKTKICAVLNGRRKSTGGYTFTYLENK